jgi:histidinol phosphatase-like PHP family hydrolase
MGFSCHGYAPFDIEYSIRSEQGYVDEIRRLKLEYEGKINIYCGVEDDYYCTCSDELYDYRIGALHYIRDEACGKYHIIDGSTEDLAACRDEMFAGDGLAMAEEYYRLLGEHISRSKPLPQADGIEFLFGCEGEVDVNYTLSIPRENFDKFGFMVIPTTHMQTPGFNIPEEDAKTPEGIAKAWVDRINAVLDMDLPFHKIGLAHPVCSLIAHNGAEEYLAALKALTNGDIARTFAKAAKVGIGIELNSYDFRRKEHITLPYVRRIFDIAKDCGCKFYLASDAHTPKDLEIAKGIFEYAVDLLGLTEDDKFHICG